MQAEWPPSKQILPATATHLVLDACAVGLAAAHAVILGVLLWLHPAGSSADTTGAQDRVNIRIMLPRIQPAMPTAHTL
jgi:ABC-type proline/glycine betaine transport system permease subunit